MMSLMLPQIKAAMSGLADTNVSMTPLRDFKLVKNGAIRFKTRGITLFLYLCSDSSSDFSKSAWVVTCRIWAASFRLRQSRQRENAVSHCREVRLEAAIRLVDAGTRMTSLRYLEMTISTSERQVHRFFEYKECLQQSIGL